MGNAHRSTHSEERIAAALRMLGQQRKRVDGKVPSAEPRDYCCPECGHTWSGKPKPKRVAPVTPADGITQTPHPAG